MWCWSIRIHCIYNNTFKILEETFDSDPNIGVINPVSNWANWTRIPFPEGFSINELKEFISSFKAPELIVDINNASGFFLAVKRELSISMVCTMKFTAQNTLK